MIIPPAVAAELAAGRAAGVDVSDPATLDWIVIRPVASAPALPLVSDLGPGEAEVLALALESSGAVVIVNDGLARRVAETLGVKLRGTLGILIDAKRAGLIAAVAPIRDELQGLRFRLARHTRQAVLQEAGEEP